MAGKLVEEASPLAESSLAVEESTTAKAAALDVKSEPEAPPEVAAMSEDAVVESQPTPKTATEKELDKPTATAAAASTSATPLSQLLSELPTIIKSADYGEMWGVTLKDGDDIPTTIVLEKFLRANPNDIVKAKTQLVDALAWRKKMNPQKLLSNTEFDSAKFGGLGFVTVYKSGDGKGKEIVTWNIYGGVKDIKATFGDVDEFIKWRSALMELSVKELDLPSATVPIPPNGEDPYRMVQVHDYMNISFLPVPPEIRAASKKTIEVMSMAYPEMVKEKFFVNVPVVMGFMFQAMKLFLSPATVKKFHPLSYGSSLAGELLGWGAQIPVLYGGKGEEAQKGLTVKYSGAESATKE